LRFDMPRTSSASRRRGPRKGDLTEQRILAEAEALLAERPPSAISVDAIAAAAGISRSSFYFYFASRDALLLTLGERAQAEVLARADRWLRRTSEPPADVVTRALAETLALWREHGPALRALYDARESSPEIQAAWRAIVKRFLDAAAAQIERERAAGVGLPGPPDSRTLAMVLTGMNDRAFYEASRRRPSRARDEELVRALSAVWLRSIYLPELYS
jgi:AcrR family transcriptional regulator